MAEKHSGFEILGPLLIPVVAKSTAYTILDTDKDVFTVDASAGAVTIILPTAADNNGRILTIIKIDSSVNAVTLDGEGTETIDGAETNSIMDAQYDSITLYCDGSEWFIIAQKITWWKKINIAFGLVWEKQ